jgi:hypothetical protein
MMLFKMLIPRRRWVAIDSDGVRIVEAHPAGARNTCTLSVDEARTIGTLLEGADRLIADPGDGWMQPDEILIPVDLSFFDRESSERIRSPVRTT